MILFGDSHVRSYIKCIFVGSGKENHLVTKQGLISHIFRLFLIRVFGLVSVKEGIGLVFGEPDIGKLGYGSLYIGGREFDAEKIFYSADKLSILDYNSTFYLPYKVYFTPSVIVD
jgi:hypothetical protein